MNGTGSQPGDAKTLVPQDVMRIGLQVIAAWMLGRGLVEALNSVLPFIWPMVRAWPIGWIPHFVAGVPLYVMASMSHRQPSKRRPSATPPPARSARPSPAETTINSNASAP